MVKLQYYMASVKRQVGCCGGARVGKSIVRNASKTIEKQMIEHADKLYENPFLVLPKFQDDISKKGFKKTSKQIEKLEKIKDDTDKLEKISNKRSLAAAIAGTLLIHHAQKAPFLAAAPITSGTVLFAQRGNALREHLIAVQHHDDPFFRLLGIRDIVLKNDLYVYSWDESFVCMGKKAAPPSDFIEFVMKKHELSFSNNIAICPHLSSEKIQNKKIYNHPYLFIHWKSADILIGICKQCASKKTNFLFETTKYLIEPDIQTDFSIEIIGHVLKGEDNDCENETLFINEYFSGRLSDKELIEKNMNQRLKKLKNSSEINYVLNKKSYAQPEEFINALHPNEHEKNALLFLLDHHQESLVVSDVTPNSVIEMLWKENGIQFLEEIVQDKDKAEDLYTLSESPSQIIKIAYDIKNRKQILKDLPVYENLPPLANFADHLARIYRIEGKDKVIIEAKKHPDGTRGKAISYGFLLAINKAKDFRWKYKKEEIESGEFLKPYIEKLLSCTTDSYDEALQDLLTFSGASIDISKYKI